MRPSVRILLIALCLLSISQPGWCQASIGSIAFEQLDWYGIGSNTANSSWLRTTVSYTGLAGIGYYNLFVGSSWVIQNLSVDAGVSQTFSAMFDSGLGHGTDVSTLLYGASIGNAPLTSFSPSTVSATVSGLAYQIGGEDGFDLGTPGKAPDMTDPTKSAVSSSAKLKDGDKLKNQVQKKNECAPGAISNSLKYLTDTGKLTGVATGIEDVKKWSGWLGSDKGTDAAWPSKKKAYLEARGLKVRFIEGPLNADKINDLLNQLRDGQDIELDLKGHVETLVGLRWKTDGTVEFDLFDDNQTDDKADPVHTARLMTDGTNQLIDGMIFERFVVECPVPEPVFFQFGALMGLGGIGVFRLRKR